MRTRSDMPGSDRSRRKVSERVQRRPSAWVPFRPEGNATRIAGTIEKIIPSNVRKCMGGPLSSHPLSWRAVQKRREVSQCTFAIYAGLSRALQAFQLTRSFPMKGAQGHVSFPKSSWRYGAQCIEVVQCWQLDADFRLGLCPRGRCWLPMGLRAIVTRAPHRRAHTGLDIAPGLFFQYSHHPRKRYVRLGKERRHVVVLRLSSRAFIKEGIHCETK